MCARCETLEKQLMRRPKIGDVEHIRERLRRKDALYEAVLARNEVLRRKLEDAERRLPSARPT